MHLILIITFLVILNSCNSSYILFNKIPEIEKKRNAKVLSAFFGLNNDLPKRTIGISPKAPGKDGMPVVFSQEIAPTTLEPSDFKIKTAKGEYFDVDIVTLIPATEAFELRTVLLIGNFGDYPKNVLDIIQKTHVDAIHFSISKNIKNIDNFSFGQDRIIDERKIQDILSLVAQKNM